MYKPEEYRAMARDIADDLEPAFREYFETVILNPPVHYELCSEMDAWLSDNGIKKEDKENPYSYINFIWFVLSTMDKESEEAHNLAKRYQEQRRQRKKYFADTAKKEKAGGFKVGIFRKGCNAYFAAQLASGGVAQEYATEAEYLRALYDRTIAWAKDPDANVVDYPFIRSINPARHLACFKVDVAYHVFRTVFEKYYGKKTDGNYTNIPPFVKDGLFSLFPGEDPLSHVVDGHSAKSYTENIVNDENGNQTKVKTVISEIGGQYGNELKAYGKDAVIRKLIETGKIQTHGVRLDSTDEALLEYVYNHFSAEDVSRGTKEIPLISMVKEIYKGSTKADRYKRVVEHLYRLSRYHVDMHTRTATGEDIFAYMSFFDVVFHVPTKDKSGENEPFLSISISENRTPDDLMDALKKADMSGIMVDIQPSMQLKETMKKDMIDANIKILTRQYASIASSKTQAVLVLLQSERIDRAPLTTCALPYKYFIERLRLNKQKMSVLKKILREQFDLLKQDSICIRDYELRSYDILIEFIPLSSDEQAMYRLPLDEQAIGS